MSLLVVCSSDKRHVACFLQWILRAETTARRRAYQQRKNRDKMKEASLDIEKGASFVILTGEVESNAAGCSIEAIKFRCSPLLSKNTDCSRWLRTC